MVDKVVTEAKDIKDVKSIPDVTVENLNNLGVEYVGFWKRLLARIIDGIIFTLFTTIFISVVVSPIILTVNKVSTDKLNSFREVLSTRIFDLSKDNKISFIDTIRYSQIPDCNFLFDGFDSDKSLCNENKTAITNSIIFEGLFSLFFGILYFVGLTVSNWKATIGKKIMKLEVVNSSSDRISLLQSFARESFWIASGVISLISPFTTFGYIVSLLIYLFIIVESFKTFFNEKRRTFHDDIADTYVITRSDNF